MPGAAGWARSLARATAELRGVGLHSGRACAVRVLPRPAGDGIWLRAGAAEPATRLDRATAARAGPAVLCSAVALADGGGRVSTVEHLLAALSAERIVGADVEVSGGEVPAMDGSSRPFVEALRAAGSASVAAARVRVLRVRKPVRCADPADARRTASLTPVAAAAPAPADGGPRLDIAVGTEFEGLGAARFAYEHSDAAAFAERVAAARTFAFADEIERLRAAGLAQGGSLDNAVLYDRATGRPRNEGGLRFADEWARHKALDAAGDLALLGAPLHGAFSAERPGHELTARLLEAAEEEGALEEEWWSS